MAVYGAFTFECDVCELETSSFWDISEGILQLMDQGWTIRDNSGYARCEDCSEENQMSGPQAPH